MIVIAEVDDFGVAQFDGHPQVVKRLQVVFVGLNAFFGGSFVERDRAQGDFEGAGIGREGVIEHLTLVFRFEETFHRFVEFAQDAAIVNDVAKFFPFEQPVDAGDGLQNSMVFKGFVNVQDGIARFVEADEQFVHDDEQIHPFGAVEVFEDFPVIGGFAPVFFHHALPELLDFRGVLHFGVFVAFTGVRRGDDHHGGEQPAFVQIKTCTDLSGQVGRVRKPKIFLRTLVISPVEVLPFQPNVL